MKNEYKIMSAYEPEYKFSMKFEADIKTLLRELSEKGKDVFLDEWSAKFRKELADRIDSAILDAKEVSELIGKLK